MMVAPSRMLSALCGIGAGAGLASASLACSARDSLRLGGETGPGGGAAASGPSTVHASSASAGGSGTGAGGGAGGSGPAPTSIVEACVIASSCGAATGWPAFSASACVDGFGTLGWYFASPGWMPDPVLAARLLTCATTADCAAFQACFGGDWVALTRCREGAWCVGDRMTEAAMGPGFDCSAIGATCMDLWSGAQRACCNAPACSVPTDPVCTGATVSYCGGWGERVTFDCGLSGRTCGADPYEPCQGTGAPCDAEAATTCAGATASYCSDGRIATQDCSANGLRTGCAAGAPPYDVPCRPSGSACDPVTDLGDCSGDSLRVCVDGEIEWVSCASLGFATCVVERSGRTRCA